MNHEKDIVKVLDFTIERRQEIDETNSDCSLLPESLPDNIKRDQLKLLSELTECNVLKFHWDSIDPRLLLIEVGRVTRKQKQTGRESEDWEKAVITLFVTQDLSYLFQDIKPLKSKHHGLVGCTAPSVYYMRKLVDSVSSLPVERLPLRDFKGLEDCDPPTVKAVLSFSYHSTMGNMDEAFKDVKNIKSKGVWETLAMMCVKTHRLDVALICLGNMGNARGAKAVREAKNIPEEDAHSFAPKGKRYLIKPPVVVLFFHAQDTAEELFLSSGRYDLLNQFYQNSGRWQKAVEVAELNDRLHLKNTYYNLAKHSESVGEIKSAIKSYEQSGTHRFEVVRMLINDPEDLSEYNLRAQDKEVQHYWAEHLECSGDLDGAIDQYRACEDYRSVARLLIFMGDTEEAIKVVEETKDKAAAYHVARVFAQSEDWYRVKKAVRFYTMAKCYSHAITVTKDFGMEAELMNLALLSTTEDKIDAAKYFETKSDSKENAILLYHRAGELSKALELCFQYRQYEVLQQIAEELTESTNPETVRRVAEYFIQQEQFEKAVQMLLQSHKLSEALEMCLRYNVIINEELAEKLTPSPAENETVEETNERVKQLNALADGLVSQGSYHLAAMKYTQASNKLQAMKALLKSGDTERVVFFANVSRQKEIYIMAANYLQSLDWRSNPTVMKNIISFYTKGRALEMLSNFYDTCAKVEIEEYQNYEKALAALNEALLVLEKSKGKHVTSIEEKKTFLKRRLELITKFIDIRSSYPDSPDQSIDQCLLLLNDPHIDTALRTGDLYAMIITHYAYQGDHQQAYKYINELRKRQPGVNLTFYIKQQTLDSINKALGTTLGGESEEKEEEEEKGGDEGSDDSIEEVVD
uniref:Uncharacterized protein n=1 Tax=Amphimedon queenslandica TaxID=400682 RepID=A0A1X7VEQ4_AMPQE